MHVFIDTNILLSFYHFSKDELDALNDVFASHEHGSAKVHLTQQVCDEFRRNRENKIIDALKRFKEVRFSPQLPSFMKGYEEFDEIRKLSSELQKKSKSILEKVHDDISSKKLLADQLIKDIFERSEIITTTDEVFNKASMRISIGNPPGKNNSIGDAINWCILLESVPDGEDLYVISQDGDFYSFINEEAVHPFLDEEWAEFKKSKLYVYRTLSRFMTEHFDGVAFSFDKEKESLIDELRYVGNFASTHALISKLESYPYFSLKEAERILDAAVENNQFGWIVTDCDVSDFLNRVAVPRSADITKEEHKKIIDAALEEQMQQEDEDA